MIHVNVYEKWWMGLTTLMLVVFAATVGVSAFMGGIQVPIPEARIDPRVVATDPKFKDGSVQMLAPGKYVAYVRAQASPWKFFPEKIEVPLNSTVTFYVTSGDVQHGFRVEGTNINVMILPGQVSKMTAKFDKAGEFPFICHEYCGVGHQNMFGKVIVK
jgi:cytochrome c oxidase subunit 2